MRINKNAIKSRKFVMELNFCENKMDEKCTEKYIDFKVTTSINNFLVNRNF